MSHGSPPEPDTLRVSVIVPAHNAAGTIQATLASALSQDPPPHEIIVAADRCTDETERIARESGAVVVQVDFGCPGSSRNAAAKVASGEVLMFLDADDLWLPGKIAAHLKAWKDHRPSFVFDRSRRVSTTGELRGASKATVERKVAWEELFDPDVWPGGSTPSLLRADFEAIGGYSQEYMFAEDVEILWQIGHRFGPGYQIEEIFTHYVQHPPQSTSVSRRPLDVDRNMGILRSRMPFLSSALFERYERALLLNRMLYSQSVGEMARFFLRMGPKVWFSATGLRLVAVRLLRGGMRLRS